MILQRWGGSGIEGICETLFPPCTDPLEFRLSTAILPLRQLEPNFCQDQLKENSPRVCFVSSSGYPALLSSTILQRNFYYRNYTSRWRTLFIRKETFASPLSLDIRFDGINLTTSTWHSKYWSGDEEVHIHWWSRTSWTDFGFRGLTSLVASRHPDKQDNGSLYIFSANLKQRWRVTIFGDFETCSRREITFSMLCIQLEHVSPRSIYIGLLHPSKSSKDPNNSHVYTNKYT